MNVLIIEDEPRTANDLKNTLFEINSSIKIVGILDSIESSVNFLSEEKDLDLIFMDIQLADGLSFEIFNEINVNVPVIFVTAFDEFMMNAFKVNSIDYILKPFNLKTIESALQKYTKLEGHFSKSKNENLIKLFKKQIKNIFLVKSLGKYFSISTTEIALFKVEDKLTFIITFLGKKYSVSYTLEQVENLVNSQIFYRANRQYLINVNAIKEVQKIENRKLLVHLKNPLKENIIISKGKATYFLNWLKKN